MGEILYVGKINSKLLKANKYLQTVTKTFINNVKPTDKNKRDGSVSE